MAMAVPGAWGLFSLLQEAFHHKDLRWRCLHLPRPVHDMLADFGTLAGDIAARSTALAKILPSTPL